jgi:hypothetical protein
MLEECGLEYRTMPVNIGGGDQFEPEFLRLPRLVAEPRGRHDPTAWPGAEQVVRSSGGVGSVTAAMATGGPRSAARPPKIPVVAITEVWNIPLPDDDVRR